MKTKFAPRRLLIIMISALSSHPSYVCTRTHTYTHMCMYAALTFVHSKAPLLSSLSFSLSSVERVYVCTCACLCGARRVKAGRLHPLTVWWVTDRAGWVGMGISTGCLPPVCLLPFTAHSSVVIRRRHRRRRLPRGRRRRRRHHHLPPTPSSPQSTSRAAARAIASSTTIRDYIAVSSSLR